MLKHLSLFQGSQGYLFLTIGVELIFLIFNQKNIPCNRLSTEAILKTHIECSSAKDFKTLKGTSLLCALERMYILL